MAMPSDFHHPRYPITTVSSRRRASESSANKTCVPPQPTQRPRRGRRHSSPPAQRNTRRRAEPHGRNTPEQSGQLNPPANNSLSTSSRSFPTMITSASGRPEDPPVTDQGEQAGGSLRVQSHRARPTPKTNILTQPVARHAAHPQRNVALYSHLRYRQSRRHRNRLRSLRSW